VISAKEIAAASESLLKLDKNGDGQLGPREYGMPPRPPGPAAERRRKEARRIGRPERHRIQKPAPAQRILSLAGAFGVAGPENSPCRGTTPAYTVRRVKTAMPPASSPERLRKRGDAGAGARGFFRGLPRKLRTQSYKSLCVVPAPHARRKEASLFQIQNRVNGRIRAREVRVILASTGQQLGVLKLSDAIRKAQELGLDLVEVAANANPPVCRIVDFGKFKYEASKQEKEKKNTGSKLKESSSG